MTLLTERALVRELLRLSADPPTVDDWRDLHDLIETYQRRCLARAIARSPNRDVLIASIRQLAEPA